jgi:hypothetical protein
MCHSALLAGTRGPNATFFSRGAGTVTALAEAIRHLAEGTCDRALVGAGDSPHDPMQRADLARTEIAEVSEGAAVLALSANATANANANANADANASRTRDPLPPTRIPATRVVSARRRALVDAASQAIDGLSAPDVIVVAAASPRNAAALASLASRAFPSAHRVDASSLGESLAATPAIAWCIALDSLRAQTHAPARALVLTAGLDSHVCAVLFERDAAGGLA